MDLHEIQPIDNIFPDFETGDMPTEQEFKELILSSYNRHAEVHAATLFSLNVNKVGDTLVSKTNAAFQISGVSYPLNSVILVKNGLPTLQGIYIVTTAGNGSTPFVLTRHQAYNTDDRIHNITVTSLENEYSGFYKITVNSYNKSVSNQLNTNGITVTNLNQDTEQELTPERFTVDLSTNIAITEGNNDNPFDNSDASFATYRSGDPVFESSISLGAIKILQNCLLQSQFAFRVTHAEGTPPILRFVVEGTAYNSTVFDKTLLTKDFEIATQDFYLDFSFVEYLGSNEHIRLTAYALSGDVTIRPQDEKKAWEGYKATMISRSITGGDGGGGGSSYDIGVGGAINLSANRILNSYDNPHESQPTWASVDDWLTVAHVAMFIKLSTNLILPKISDNTIKWQLAAVTNSFVKDRVNMLDIVKKGDTVTVGIHSWANDEAISEVVITGGSNEGDTLTASYSFVGGGTVDSVTYQWKNNGADIVGETNSTYTGQSENDNISVEVSANQILGNVVVPLQSVESNSVLIGASGGGSEVTIGVVTNGYTGTPSGDSETGAYTIPGSNQSEVVRLFSVGNKATFDYNIVASGNYLIKARVRIGNSASNPTNYQNAYIVRSTPNGGSTLNHSIALFDNETSEYTGTAVGTIVWGHIITQSIQNFPSGIATFEIEANVGYPAGVIDEIVLIPQ